jgi:hypothetical protein
MILFAMFKSPIHDAPCHTFGTIEKPLMNRGAFFNVSTYEARINEYLNFKFFLKKIKINLFT